MALLNYANITSHRPDVLMKKTFDGLGIFFKYLDTTKGYLESDKAVKRLAWDVAKPEPNEKLERKEVWIQLLEPEGVGSDVELFFKQFLDENNKEVYEANHSNWASVASPAIDCSTCRQKNGRPKLAYQTYEQANDVANNTKHQLGVYECPDGNGWHLTRDLTGNISFSPSNSIRILGRKPEKEQLLLERLPEEEYLVLRPNTYQLKCQIRAIQSLQDSPAPMHRPLLKLFESSSHAEWDNVLLDPFEYGLPDLKKLPEPYDEKFHDAYNGGVFKNLSNEEQLEKLIDLCDIDVMNEWYVLTDDERSGTDEQRKFVEIALNTPDFAFLEGPPGSGKTTAICELIIQLALRGKRTLLCASTHVAVDNVLERLMAEDNPHRDHILPVRIGDKESVSEKVKPWRLEEFIRTERSRLMGKLQGSSNISNSQRVLLEQLRSGNNFIERIILDCSNLVCGTTIGILQHPDIKKKGTQNPQFDMMIIDEASKTTFQEFLVPALLAKRWVLVGDPKQLSPYVDDESTAVNIESCLPDEYKRSACIDVFQAKLPQNDKRINSLICTSNEAEIEFYTQQAHSHNLLISTENENLNKISYAALVVGSDDFVNENMNNLPLDLSHIRSECSLLPDIYRRIDAFTSLKYRSKIAPMKWENEISWRLTRKYEQRNNVDNKRSTKDRLNSQIKALLPFDEDNEQGSTWEKINQVRRVALPSVLESLQQGFERGKRQREGTALSDGLPEDQLKNRCVLLSYQHRMHPDITDFPHREIYQEKALFTDEIMTEKRNWSYKPERKKSIWTDVNGSVNRKINSNIAEAKKLIQELKEFDDWAKFNPKDDKKPWEVAILTFYRGQERELRKHLRKWAKNYSGFRHFKRGSKHSPYLDIQVCTVDKFQGNEADLVLLSFMNTHATSFLESPNRLNVAITRARYQLVVFGNRNSMKKASGALGKFAKEAVWSRSIEGSK